jgi:predicted RNase H-like nuclease (RuvC/YqgF family)
MAEAMLEDMVTKVEAEAFEPGKKIFVVSEAGEKGPAPEGVHTTEDGTKVTVDSEGTITAVEKPEPKVEVEIEAAKEEEKMEEEPVKTEKEIIEQDMKEMIMQCMEAIEEVAKEVAMVKEDMAAYKTKMEKLSKEPASSKISTFSANPMSEKVDALDARVEQLKSLRTSIKPNRKF